MNSNPMTELNNAMSSSVQNGHWAVICLDANRRHFAMTLPEAEAIRKFWHGKHSRARVTIRPLTEAAITELYRLNGWPRPTCTASAARG